MLFDIPPRLITVITVIPSDNIYLLLQECSQLSSKQPNTTNGPAILQDIPGMFARLVSLLPVYTTLNTINS